MRRTAQFSVSDKYTITFDEGITVNDGAITSGEKVDYGTILTATADPKDRYIPISATAGNISENEMYAVVGDVQFTVHYTVNIDESGGLITEKDKPRVELSEDVAEQVITNENFKKIGTKIPRVRNRHLSTS